MKQNTRLLILTHNYPRYPGDYAGVFLSLLARRLVDEGIRPVVLAPHDEGIAEYEENSGVRIYRFRYHEDESRETLAYRGNMQNLVLGSLGGLYRFRCFLKSFRRAAISVIEKEDIDVIAGHWLVPAAIVMKRIARQVALPMVLSSHGTDIRLMRKTGRLPYRYFRGFCRGLSRWTVVSNFLREQVLQLDPALGDIVEVLPLPHDEKLFFKDAKVKRDDCLVVSVTRFTEQKRVDYLIKAFAAVTQEVPAARMEIYGAGPLESDVERQIAAHGLARQVTLCGPVGQAQLREVYNRAAIVVLNSYREGFGLTLSEAMMCGAAVIGTRSGGITDIIEHEQRGLLVEQDNARELAGAMVRLLRDQPLRQRLAEAGHGFAHETYASVPLAARYAAIVRQAIGG